jgi:HrpA-like RNA helicase
VKRTPLESVALQIKSYGSDPRTFAFLEAPSPDSIERAISLLKSSGALNFDFGESITPLGNVLSRLPIDISIGKMLVLGSVFHIVDSLLALVAAITVQSPFLMKAKEDAVAVCLHAVCVC